MSLPQRSDGLAQTVALRGPAGPMHEAGTVQLCTFQIDAWCFGIDVTRVQEVIRFMEATHVPLASQIVAGLVNLRGQIVTAIDLRRMLDMEALPAGQAPMNIVVRTGDEVLSLLVDSIGDVIDASRSDFEPPPDTLDARSRTLIDGVYKLEQGLVLALDLDAAIRTVHSSGAAA